MTAEEIKLAETKRRGRERQLAEHADRVISVSGTLHHVGTFQQWVDFRKELNILLQKHKIENYPCLHTTVIWKNGKRTPISQP